MQPHLSSKSRLTAAFLILLALWVLLSLFGIARGFTTFLAFVELGLGSVLLFRSARYLIRQSVWRLRNRLIVTYTLIGILPVFLILILVVMGGYIVAGQVAVFMISAELDRRTQALTEPAQIMSWSDLDSRGRVLNQLAPLVRNHFPRIQMLIHGDDDLRYPEDCPLKAPPTGWADHAGLLRREGRFYTWAHVSRNKSEVILLEPIDNRLLSNLIPNLGDVRLVEERSNVPAGAEDNSEPIRIPPPLNNLDREVTWWAQVSAAEWDAPGRISQYTMVVTTRPSAVLASVFGEKFIFGQGGLYFFLCVAIVFVMMEGVAVFAAIRLTRTVTGAVHTLYDGTQRITRGDFSHRISIQGRDQLATLATSFNSMAENLERLFHVEKEKERLQSELEIAREVQNQLFPKNAPTLRTMEITGVCQAARMVSGDYYDFLCMDDNRVAFALGDVAGKGISAALLMASIQSIMRTQLRETQLHETRLQETKIAFSVSAAVALLNRQLFASTSPEKYATFWFGVYNENTHVLTYTNAGHLPPLLIRQGQAVPLEVTGTVVGAFPTVRFEERDLPLLAGDLLVAYTDGIAEPENEYGEEFGVDRLTEVILRHQSGTSQEIIARVLEAVAQWTGGGEQFDDMTILLARVVS